MIKKHILLRDGDSMLLSWTHWLFMSVSFLLIIGAVTYSHKQAKSLEGFSVSGRKASRYMVAGTFVGTMLGGSMTVGTVQSANIAGLQAGWMILGSAIGAIILGVFYATPLRNSGEATIGSYMAHHYGPLTGTVMSVVSTLGIYFSLVASGLSGLHFIQLMVPVNLWGALAILLLAVFLYVLVGGIKGTSISGLIKAGLIYLTLFSAGIVAFLGLNGSYPQWLHDAHFVINTPAQVGTFVDKMFSTIIGITVTQTYAQAVFSGRDTKEAKWGCFLSAAIMMPLSFPLISIGSFVHHAHPQLSSVESLPFFLLTYLPDWLGGLALGAVFISIVGSIAGLSLGAATTLTIDICEKFLGISNKKTLLLLLRGFIVLTTVSAFSISIMNYHSEILTWNFLSFSLRGTGIFLLLLLAVKGHAFSSHRTAPWIVLVSTLASCLYLLLPVKIFSPLTSLDIGIICSGILLIVEWIMMKKN